jgi:thiol-disulfide isomerase/thioredoxin
VADVCRMRRRSSVCRGLVSLAAVLAFAASTAGAQAASASVGDLAPAPAVHDLDGKPVDLGTWIGRKPVFLEFWATWCTSCAALMPVVREAHARYGDEVEFVGVNVTVGETPDRVREYLATHQPPFRTLYDDEGVSQRAYDVPATSYVVIIDRQGRIVYTGVGGTQRFDDALKRVTAG